MGKEIPFLLRFLSLILAVFISFKILTGSLSILATGIILIAIAFYAGIVPVLVSIAIFGLPFLTVAGSKLGLTPTPIVIVFVCIALIIAIRKLGGNFFSSSFVGFRRFFVWWMSLFFLYFIYVSLGKDSEYSTYAWKFLLVYGSFYALTGMLAVKVRVLPLEVLIISLPIFSFNYSLIDASPFTLDNVIHEEIGLRIKEEFDAINAARTAGLVFLMAFVMPSSGNVRMLPYLTTTVVLSWPLVWYSYTRQVLLALILVSVWIFFKVIIIDRLYLAGSRKKIINMLIIFFPIIFSLIIFFLNSSADFLSNGSQSRLTQYNEDLYRISLWKKSIELIFDNPLIGIGVGGLSDYTEYKWPHNWFIEAWLALGILGFLLALVSGAVIFKALITQCDDWVYAWIMLGFYFLLTAQFSADIPRNSVLLFFLPFAFHVTSAKRC